MNTINTVKKINYSKKCDGKDQLAMGHKPVGPHIQLCPESALRRARVAGKETLT